MDRVDPQIAPNTIITKLLLASAYAFEVETIGASTYDSLNKRLQDRGCLKILCNYEYDCLLKVTDGTRDSPLMCSQ